MTPGGWGFGRSRAKQAKCPLTDQNPSCDCPDGHRRPGHSIILCTYKNIMMLTFDGPWGVAPVPAIVPRERSPCRCGPRVRQGRSHSRICTPFLTLHLPPSPSLSLTLLHSPALLLHMPASITHPPALPSSHPRVPFCVPVPVRRRPACGCQFLQILHHAPRTRSSPAAHAYHCHHVDGRCSRRLTG